MRDIIQAIDEMHIAVVNAIQNQGGGAGMPTVADLTITPEDGAGWYFVTSEGAFWEYDEASVWRSTERHAALTPGALVLGSSLAAPNNNLYLLVPNSEALSNYVVQLRSVSLRVMTNYPNDGVNYWTLRLERGSTNALVWSYATNGLTDSADELVIDDISNQVPGLLRMRPISTGSPGAIIFTAHLKYRLVVAVA